MQAQQRGRRPGWRQIPDPNIWKDPEKEGGSDVGEEREREREERGERREERGERREREREVFFYISFAKKMIGGNGRESY